MTNEKQSEFHKILTILCNQELWNESNAYDACHALMIPLHYAYYSNDSIAIELFEQMFDRFAQSTIIDGDEYREPNIQSLGKTQFLYLCSQYLCLSTAKTHELSENQLLMYNAIKAYANYYIYDTKAIYGIENNGAEHIQAILEHKKYNKSYYSAFIDGERFALAMLCDCKSIDIITENTPDESENKASEWYYSLLTDEEINVNTEKGGWIFQRGVYYDHDDYLYAGHSKLESGLTKLQLENVCSDTSHFHRFPLLINSAIAAQMKEYVLIEENGYWFTSTFMDGRCGLYRYDSVSGNGFEGYGLSSTLFAGWWAMLQDQDIKEMYYDLANLFPLYNDSTNPYLGMETGEKDNPYLIGNDAWEKGWYECIVWCAACL